MTRSALRRFVRGLLMLAAIMFVPAVGARADTVKIVVPFAAGGPADMLARLLAQDLQQRLGDTFVIENKGGAGGMLGTETVARAAPDGRTVLLGSMGSHVISPALRTQLPYDPVKSFSPIVLVGSVQALLVIRPQIEAKTLAEFIALAKKGQKLSYGSAGPGTTMNIAGEMLNVAAGIKAAHVPYRGAGPAINDLLGGHVDFLLADLPVLLPLVKNNSVRPLALFADQRSSLLPDVPTAKELGFPEMRMESWYGTFVPADVPDAAQARLEKAILDAIATPTVGERLKTSGLSGTKGRADFKQRLEADFAYWGPAIKKLGIVGE